MKVSKYFTIQELVPKSLFNDYGERSVWFIDPRLLKLLDVLRTHFNAPITVNNWATGGTFQNRGFRSPSTTVGGRLSQHKFGRAADINVKGKTAKEVYNEILANEPFFMKAGLTTLESVEMTPTWTHIDIRNTGLDHILIVTP